MSDMDAESKAAVNEINKPAKTEAEILKEPPAQTVEKKDAEPEVEKLPKLSASDFRAYNTMAEHMEYFVRANT